MNLKTLTLCVLLILGFTYLTSAQTTVTLVNKSIYIGWIDVEYTDNTGPQKLESGDVLQDATKTMVTSASAKNITVTPWYKQLTTWKKMTPFQISGSGTVTISGNLSVTQSWQAEQSESGGGTVAAGSVDTPGSNGDYKIHVAVRIGTVSDVQQLITAGTKMLNTKNNSGNAPLHEALRMGKQEMVAPLIQGGADVNLKNGKGEAPILLAVKKRDPNLVKEVLSYSPSVTEQVVIREAVKIGNKEMIKDLIGAGAKPAIAAEQAIESRKDDLFTSIVISYGVPVKIDWYKTALSNRKTDLANNMLEMGLDPNLAMDEAFKVENKSAMMVALDKGGAPGHVLTYAVNKSDETMAQAAIDKGADINYNYPLVLSTKNKKMLPIFLQSGADPNKALEKAVEDKDVQFAEIAINYQASADQFMGKAITNTDAPMVTLLVNYVSNATEYVPQAVNTGNKKMVETLINNGGADPGSGLQPAMTGEKYDIAQFLIEMGAPPDNVVKTAVEKNQMNLLKTALNSGADPNEGMASAVSANNTEYVNLLIDTGADGSPDNFIRTAAQNQNTEMITALVNAGASPEPAMPVAVNANNTQLFKLLVNAGGNAGNTDYVKTAASNANMEILTEAVQQGGDPNPALPTAVQKDHVEMTKFLLDNGADASTPGLLAKAAEGSGTAVIQLLLDSGANPQDGAEAAINRGNDAIVRQLMNAGADFSRNEFMQSAASRNLPKLTALLLEAGGSPDAGMIDAVKGNYTEVIMQFVNAGASLQDPQVLAYPAANGNAPVVKLMLDNGADPNNGTASAIKYNQNGVLDMLLTAGADGSSDDFMTTAANNKNAGIVSRLIEAGGNPQLAVPISVKGNDPNVLDVACKGGADCTGTLGILLAVENNYLDIARILLNSGADANARYIPETGNTLLHMAAKNSNASMLQLLVRKGANPKATAGANNLTPLHILVDDGKDSLEHANILIQAGADVNAKDASGVSVFKHAKSRKMKKLLIDNGADKKG